jgi:hypothetical protein
MEQLAHAGESGRFAVLKDRMELLDEHHFNDVVKILHRAKSGTLHTRAGRRLVHPTLSTDPSYLLAISVPDDLDPNTLEIDGLEFHFGEAVFSVGCESLHIADGAIHVIPHPEHLYSAGIRGLELRPDVAWLELMLDGELHHLAVQEYSVDEIVVMPSAPLRVDTELHPATVCLRLPEGVGEVACSVLFRGFVNDGEVHFQLITTAGDRVKLARAYSQFRFPRLHDRGALESHRVVELFEESGYLDLRETESDGPSAAWCRPDFAHKVSVDTIYQATDSTLLGHVSVTRAYSRTWLGHQLATLKGHPESAACREALYHHFATIPVVMDGAENIYLLGYYNPELRWHQLFFEGFVNWVGDLDRVAILPFDRFEPSDSDAPAIRTPPPPGIDIRRGTADDVPAAVALIRDLMPDLALNAFDITEEHLITEHLHPSYKDSAVERSRQAIVAYQDGVLVGVALCEFGSPDLSLFNLLNLAQVYAVKRTHPGISAALFSAVRELYASRGIYDPVLVAPPSRCKNPGAAGLRLDETMGCIIWAGETLEQYQSYVQFCIEKIGGHSLTRTNG